MSALSSVPRLLRMLLQSMQVDDLSEVELPQLGRILCTLLQHVPLHSQLLANSHLLQEIIQQLTVGKTLMTPPQQQPRRLQETSPRTTEELTGFVFCARVCSRGIPEAAPGSSG